jgi:hypothetical protein
VATGDRDFAGPLRDAAAEGFSTLLFHFGLLSPGVAANASYQSARWVEIIESRSLTAHGFQRASVSAPGQATSISVIIIPQAVSVPKAFSLLTMASTRSARTASSCSTMFLPNSNSLELSIPSYPGPSRAGTRSSKPVNLWPLGVLLNGPPDPLLVRAPFLDVLNKAGSPWRKGKDQGEMSRLKKEPIGSGLVHCMRCVLRGNPKHFRVSDAGLRVG